MIWHVATNGRFRDSRAEIKTWYFDELIAACELIDALDKAEAEHRETIEAEKPQGV